MFIKKATKNHLVLGPKIALVSALSLSLAAGSVALAAPVQAAGYEGHTASAQALPSFVKGHTTAETPDGWYRHGHTSVAYRGNVYFPHGSFLVEVLQQQWEYDGGLGKDDYLGTSYFGKYINNGGTFAFKSTHPLKRTDWDGTEEVYQRVSYRVYRNGHWSAWSKWVYSGTAHIPW